MFNNINQNPFSGIIENSISIETNNNTNSNQKKKEVGERYRNPFLIFFTSIFRI